MNAANRNISFEKKLFENFFALHFDEMIPNFTPI